MLELLTKLDTQLLLFLNGNHNAFCDNFFWVFTHLPVWIPTFAAIVYVLIRSKKLDAIWIILAMALTILLADQISSSVFKPLVARLRPTRDPALEGMVHIVRGYTGGKFGFVSSHAANSIGIALFTSLIFRNKLLTFSIFTWAIINAYSRIYLGVHYPLDIICGGIVGALSAFGSYYLLRKFSPNALNTELDRYAMNYEKRVSGKFQTSIILITLWASIFLILVLNSYLAPLF